MNPDSSVIQRVAQSYLISHPGCLSWWWQQKQDATAHISVALIHTRSPQYKHPQENMKQKCTEQPVPNSYKKNPYNICDRPVLTTERNAEIMAYVGFPECRCGKRWGFQSKTAGGEPLHQLFRYTHETFRSYSQHCYFKHHKSPNTTFTTLHC